jgi:transcriptional regulator GlxA family with amidase domain
LRGVAQDDRLHYLARSLSARLAPIDTDSLSIVDHALAIIGAVHGNVAIERVAARVGITRRHLERHFREHVGLGAKHFARISRVHAVLALLQQQPSMSGAEIAAACGYSDQAHLIRECRQLTGQTPRRLKTTQRSLAGLMRGRNRHEPA